VPIYEYQVAEGAKGCGHCSAPFEVRQRMSDAPLAACPECGAKVVRLVSACAVDTKPSPKSQLSDKNLKRLGFTKLVNEGGGKFRKTV
jgi:putative FmdB family regulatory protein